MGVLYSEYTACQKMYCAGILLQFFIPLLYIILSFKLENCLNDAAFHSSIDNLMFTLKPQA